MRNRFGAALATLVLLSAAYLAWAETVTISTYYPSPYGAYQTLTTTSNTYLATAGGNVGIGTAAPTGKLHIRETSSQIILEDADEGGSLRVERDGGGLNVELVSSGANLFRVNDNGNVGIGTTGPATKLDVAGGIRNSAPSQGTLELSGLLPGYSDNTYPTLKTTGTWLYFAAGNKYIGYWGPSAFAVYNSTTNIHNIYSDTTTGNTGIGMTVPAERLDVAGNIHASGIVTASSDARFKTNLQPLTGVLPKLNNLNAISYEPSKLGVSVGQKASQKQIGIVGQELEKVFPELVLKNGPEEYRSVDYGRLSVVLLEALKELKADNERLEKRIHALEAENPQ